MDEEVEKPVPAEGRLWRRVPEWHWVEDGAGGIRPSSAAFEDDPDDSPMSATVAAESTIARTLDPVRNHEKAFAVAEFPAATARGLGQSVERKPKPNEPAHVFVVGPKPKRVGRVLAHASVWAWPPPGRPYPEHDTPQDQEVSDNALPRDAEESAATAPTILGASADGQAPRSAVSEPTPLAAARRAAVLWVWFVWVTSVCVLGLVAAWLLFF